ncbi:hypothetical protein F2Q70_00017279 [Brassica cretica]|uniref:Uncharacterized protein n=1 Tax=Brassica cretica TaxID=69181 RepID=A0A8S9KWM4_BRACR|nr:hypothetical protein F2Q70_00017279 [Brassica cretica]KAF2598915.1 hypothetical protein F2Q68_00010230 [Brassica cretica]
MSKSPKKKTKKLLRQTLFRNRFFFTKSFAEETRVIGQELEKDRYAATKNVLRSVATQRPNTCSARLLRSDRARVETRSLRSDRVLPKHRYGISPCILLYPSMLSPEDRSEPILRSPPFYVIDQTLP